MRQTASVFFCCAAAVTAMSAVAQSQNTNDVSVSLKSGPLMLRSVAKPAAGAPRSAPGAQSAGGPAVLSFTRRLTELEQEALAKKGIRIIDYLEQNAYIARVPTLDPAALGELSKDINPITHLGSLDDPGRKIGTELATQLKQNATRTRGPGQPVPQVLLNVVLWPDADLNAVSKELGSIARVVRISKETKSIEIAVAGLIEAQAIASKAGVRYVEPATRPVRQNDSIRKNMKVAVAWEAPHGLQGNGVTVGVFDGDLAADKHPALSGRLTFGEQPETPGDPDDKAHATHVSGTIAGTGAFETAMAESARQRGTDFRTVYEPSVPTTISKQIKGALQKAASIGTKEMDIAPNQYAGVAPAARIVSFRFDNPHTKMIAAAAGNLIDVANNSWGFLPVATNPADPTQRIPYCGTFGAYVTLNLFFDGLVNGRVLVPAENDQWQWVAIRRIPVVFSAGNARADRTYAGPCGLNLTPPFLNYKTVLPPGTSKNVITVGAIDADTNKMTPFSSYGPTFDRRIKPDVVAPGCRQFAGKRSGIISSVPENTMGKACGTSMAAPAVTGVVALLIEKLQKAGFDKNAVYPSTYKAMLIHAAEDLGREGPDYEYGFGRVRVPETLVLVDRRVFQQGIVQAEAELIQADVEVRAGAKSLRATLVWDDRPSALERGGGLVNDLDLELIGPDGKKHLPLAPSPLPGEEGLPARPAVDSVNVVEQTIVPNPAAGRWKAIVKGTRLGLAPQSYSIVLTAE